MGAEMDWQERKAERGIKTERKLEVMDEEAGKRAGQVYKESEK